MLGWWSFYLARHTLISISGPELLLPAAWLRCAWEISDLRPVRWPKRLRWLHPNQWPEFLKWWKTRTNSWKLYCEVHKSTVTPPPQIHKHKLISDPILDLIEIPFTALGQVWAMSAAPQSSWQSSSSHREQTASRRMRWKRKLVLHIFSVMSPLLLCPCFCPSCFPKRCQSLAWVLMAAQNLGYRAMHQTPGHSV